MCATALKTADGRQKHHTQAGLHVYCERALKSAGERTRRTGGPVRGPSGNRPPPARNAKEAAPRGVVGGGLLHSAWHRQQ
jgi:hypothetical protein